MIEDPGSAMPIRGVPPCKYLIQGVINSLKQHAAICLYPTTITRSDFSWYTETLLRLPYRQSEVTVHCIRWDDFVP